MKTSIVRCWTAGALLTLAAAPGSTQGLENVAVHGFGGWAFAETDDNSYLIGNAEGAYDNAAFALNVTARPTENLSIIGQFELQQRAEFPDLETVLDYGFAEWKFADTLRLRAGRVKHPFGLYGETFNVGTLRPFYLLPQSIYGPERYTARSVDGGALTGNLAWGEGWSVRYDLYGGRISGRLRISGIGVPEEEPLQHGLQEIPWGFDDVVGLRANLSTPLTGLSVGGSFYRGVATGFFSVGETEKVVGVHVEYDLEPWQVRAEWASIFDDPIVRFDTYYVEVAYKVWKGLQLAVRWDSWSGDIKLPPELLPPFVYDIQDSEDWGLAVNYWLDPGFVIKLNYHMVEGNRFASAPVPDDQLTNGFEKDTSMLVLGAQFSF